MAKADQFLSASTNALNGSQHDAALLLAIHAAISATDAVTAALSGLRSADPDHLRAADLLESVARGSEEIHDKANQLRSLLKVKNLVEYEDRRSTAREAEAGVKRADRLAVWARAQVGKARV
jgi:hypothetical protein